jgi:hypothetical protein
VAEFTGEEDTGSVPLGMLKNPSVPPARGPAVHAGSRER